MPIYKCVCSLFVLTGLLLCTQWHEILSAENIPSKAGEEEYRTVLQSVPRTTESVIFSQGKISPKLIYPGIEEDADTGKQLQPPSVSPYNGQQPEKEKEELGSKRFTPLDQIIIAKELRDILDSLTKNGADMKRMDSLLKKHLNEKVITTIHASALSHFYPRVSINQSHAIEFQTNKQSFPESDYCRFLIFSDDSGQQFFADFQKMYSIQPSRSLIIQKIEVREYLCQAVKNDDESNDVITYRIYFGQLSPTLFVYSSKLEYLTETIHAYARINSGIATSNAEDKIASNNSLLKSKEYSVLDKSGTCWGIRLYREEASKKYEKIIPFWEKSFSGMGFEYDSNKGKERFVFKIYTSDIKSKEIAENNLLSPRYFKPAYYPDRIEISLRSPKEGEVPRYRPSNGLSDNQNLTSVAMGLLDNLGW